MSESIESLKRTLQLLEMEEKSSLEQYTNEVLQAPLHERKEKGLAWHPVRISNKDYGFGEQFFLSFERTSKHGGPSQFQVGDRAALSSYENGKRKESINGIVVAAWRDSIKVAFAIEELPDWAEDGGLGLDVLFDDASFKEMKLALKLAMQAEGRLKDLREVLLGFAQPRTQEVNFFQPIPALNVSQNEAVKAILCAQDVALVHGPPGTGKTTTLVQAIKMVLQNEKQVLVCAPSNTAVDLLTEKLTAKGLNVVRIGNPARVSEDQQSRTLEALISGHPDHKLLKKMRKDVSAFRDMAHKYKRQFGRDEREQRKLLFAEAKKIQEQSGKMEDYIVEDVLNKAQVITSTLVGAVNKYIKKRRFSTVFIDEAGQALEPACWIPIAKSDRVVLAGDHCQLPPTVRDEEAAKLGLSKTLFEKCMGGVVGRRPTTERPVVGLRPTTERPVVGLRPTIGVMLDTQYRMHEAIMGFSSQEFYHGALKAHASVAQRVLAENDWILAQPLEWVDTAGCGFEEERGDQSSSLQNKGEADVVARHLEMLLSHIRTSYPEKLEGLSVGVISPYSGQVICLKNRLQGIDLQEVHVRVHTVDGFQGQEQDIIYISMVRGNDKGVVGFLQDTRRMNVALTRAKSKLVVVGDSATIGQHPFYKRFLDYADKMGAYKSAWEFMG